MRPGAEASIPTPRQAPAGQGLVTLAVIGKGMPVDAQAGLVAEFEKYIEQNGGYSTGYGWYAGVTSDPQRRLFREHRVDRNDAAWIFAKAPSDDDARAVERYLVEKGAKGGSGGGDESAVYAYAYRITWSTEE